MTQNNGKTEFQASESVSGTICCCIVAQLCLSLCCPTDCSPPGSYVHGISQARILERVAISFSRRSSWPRDRTQVFCIGRRILYHWATWKGFQYHIPLPKMSHVNSDPSLSKHCVKGTGGMLLVLWWHYGWGIQEGMIPVLLITTFTVGL